MPSYDQRKAVPAPGAGNHYSADPRPGGCLVQDANLLLIGAAFLADQRSQGGGA
jgi:hypothetical protein